MLKLFFKFFVIAIIFGLIAKYFFQLYYIPTSSMEKTLFAGDGLIAYRLHAPFKVNHNDVVIFKPFAGDDELLIKRLIGMPGDSVQVIDGQILVNNKEVIIPLAVHDYKFKLMANSRIYTMPFVPNMIGAERRKSGILTLRNEEARDVLKADSTLYLKKIIKKGGNNYKLFPAAMAKYWSRDNYGPLLVPSKGQKLRLDSISFSIYRQLIENEGNDVAVQNGKYLINGLAANFYVVKNNYYFMMGDNRHHSHDSRWMGVFNEASLIAKAKLILWSRDTATHDLRLNRFFKLIY